MIKIAAVALLLVSSMATAADDKSAKPPKGSPEEVVCRQQPVPGSLVPRKTCMTRAQWTAQREGARAEAESATARGLINRCGVRVGGEC